MPFGLKNAGSTYQMMMFKMFESQMSKNIEVYIDNMVVKSKIASKHIEDLTKIFEILRGHKLKKGSLSLQDLSFLVHPFEKSPECHFSGTSGINPGKHLHTNLLFGLQLPNFPQKL